MLQAPMQLTDEDKEFVQFVESDSFPVFRQHSVGNYSCFTHTLMRRHRLGIPTRGEINSAHYEAAEMLFLNFCDQQNIKVNNIIRAAINFNTYEGEGWLPPHVDHDFPHQVFIGYLNEFSNGSTYLFDDDENVIHEFVPKLNDAIVFDGQTKHSASSPKPSEVRIVLVITFD